MLLYFPLSPSSTIHILLHFNSDFLAMNYESSIDRKKKDLLQIFLLFDMYLSRSCKHVGIIVVGLFWLNFVKSLSLFFLINLRIANWVYWDVLFFSFGSNWAFYQVKKTIRNQDCLIWMIVTILPKILERFGSILDKWNHKIVGSYDLDRDLTTIHYHL